MSNCRNCKDGIYLAADDGGQFVWVHDFESTVCHDGTLNVAEPACDHPGGDCTAQTRWYVMGAYPGDWAVRVCDEHRDWAHRAFAPYIEYPEHAPPADQPPAAVG